MKQSYLTKYAPAVAQLLHKLQSEFIEKPEEKGFLYDALLRKDFSLTMDWTAISGQSHNVSADLVSLGSPAPIKSRGSLSTVGGKINKMAMKLNMTEPQFQEVMTMQKMGIPFKTIVDKIFDDKRRVYLGIKYKVEDIFLRGLSTGYGLAEDGTDETGIRISYGFLDENKFSPAIRWGKTGSNPLEDLRRAIRRTDSDGNKATFSYWGRRAFDNFRKSKEVKAFYAEYRGRVYEDSANAPSITSDQKLKDAIKEEFGIEVIVVDKKIYTEDKGITTEHTPFDQDAITFTNTRNIGRLVWSTLVEMEHKVEGVEYTTLDDYILVSSFGSPDPITESTKAEAMVMPVIEGVESIYLLETQGGLLVDEDETESDDYITILGITYLKAQVIGQLEAMGLVVPTPITDAQLIVFINKLPASQLNELIKKFPKLDPNALTFTSAADSTGKEVNVPTAGTVTTTVDPEDDWVTATVSGKKVTVKVTKNETEAARTALILVTQNSISTILTVTQAKAV